VAIEDKAVDEAVQHMRERLAHFEPAAGRAAEAGDLLRVDFDATVDGKPLAALAPKEKGLGEARDFMVFLGDPEFLPGFTAGLTGVKEGDTRTVAVTFPANYPVAALAGKAAEYRVAVKGVQQRTLPAVNDEFCKQFGADSEAALRANFREQLEAAAQRSELARQKNEIARFLLERTAFELPQSVVDRETQLAVRQMVQDLARRGGTRDQIVEQQDNIVSEATRSSTDRVRLTYILIRIADEEKIEVTEDEVRAHLEALAQRYQMPMERLRQEMEKRDALEGLARDIRAEKTLDFLQKQARVK
jgi:trigger factor